MKREKEQSWVHSGQPLAKSHARCLFSVSDHGSGNLYSLYFTSKIYDLHLNHNARSISLLIAPSGTTAHSYSSVTLYTKE